MKRNNYFNNQDFISPTKGIINLDGVISELKLFIEEDQLSICRLVIGSDSHTYYLNHKHISSFVTAIIIYRKGLGGRYFGINCPPTGHFRCGKKFIPKHQFRLN